MGPSGRNSSDSSSNTKEAQAEKGSHLLILHFDQLLCLSVWCWERQDGNRAFYPVVLSQLAGETEREEMQSVVVQAGWL